MQVDPVGDGGIQQIYQFYQQFFICLIHNTCHRVTYNVIACVNNDKCKQDGHCIVKPGNVCEVDDNKTCNNAQCGMVSDCRCLPLAIKSRVIDFFSFTYTDIAYYYNLTMKCENSYQYNTLIVDAVHGDVYKIVDSFVNDDQPGDHNISVPSTAADRNSRFTVTVRMVFVAWLAATYRLYNPYQAGHYVHSAFQCIS